MNTEASWHRCAAAGIEQLRRLRHCEVQAARRPLENRNPSSLEARWQIELHRRATLKILGPAWSTPDYRLVLRSVAPVSPWFLIIF